MTEKNVTKIEHEEKKLEDRELSSGETKELEKEQLEFNSIFEDYADEEEVELKLWNLYLENDQIDERQAKLFFDKVAELKYVPVYKYVIRYLLLRYHISVGEENKEGLYKYLEKYKETENVHINKRLGEKEKNKLLEKLQREEDEEVYSFTEEDYDTLMLIIIQRMKEEFLYNGYTKKSVRSRYFFNLITQLDEDKLREMALGLNLTYEKFALFRKKALRKKEINIYNRKDILLSFVLKYATECGYNNYFEAYDLLEDLYPKQKKNKENEVPTTRALTDWFKQHLEVNGKLKEEYKDTLFTQYDPEIGQELSVLESITKKERKGKRRAEKKFVEEWEEVLSNTKEYVKVIKWEEGKEKKNDSHMQEEGNKESNWSNQNEYEFLYGRNVLKRNLNRIEDIKEKDMRILGKERKDYFLDSNVFLKTRIRDNFRLAFPVDEETQRNLLLTVLFLNFAMEPDGLSDDYGERIEDFSFSVDRNLNECGFMPLYSGYAYDAFLKLVLSCDSPLELFRYIWRQKTKSVN